MLELFNISLQNYPLVTALKSMLPLGAVASILGAIAIQNKGRAISDYYNNGAFIGALVAYALWSVYITPFVFLFAWLGAFISIILLSMAVSYSSNNLNISKFVLSSMLFSVAVIVLRLVEIHVKSVDISLLSFIFGDAETILTNEINISSYVSITSLIILALSIKQFKIIAIDPDFAQSIHIPVKFYTFLYIVLLSCISAIGIQSMGILFLSTLLLVPAITARLYTSGTYTYYALTIAIGIISTFIGSVIAANSHYVITGSVTTVVLFVIFILSLIYTKIICPSVKKLFHSVRVTNV